MDAMGATSRTGRLPELAKYDVLEEIGHGGMATVYRARDRRLAREVAVKVIHPHLRDSAEVAHRFAVEARAVAKLRHANIVEVFDVSGEDEPEQYLVVELLLGVTLRKLLQQRAAIARTSADDARGPLPTEVAAALAIELLDALAHAHGAGVIHRDVKPENVIIEHRLAASAAAANDGTQAPRVLVKLTDFGIAKLLDAQGVTSTGQVLGSPAHMAPEQIEGGDVDARADVFGHGVLLYECMVGHLPFEGNNPAQVLRRVLEGTYPRAENERATIGKVWSGILDRALAHDPRDRFVDANEMRAALKQELKRLGVTSPREELEAWFDDPEGYAEAHAKRFVEVLCARAGEARKSGDTLSAAADYNRALAYAPNDPTLLRIVGSMHRAEARARFLKQAARIAALTIVLGCAAFFITRALRPAPIVADTPRATSPSNASLADSAPTAKITAAPEAASSLAIRDTAPAPHPAPMPIGLIAPKLATRKISISVRPEQGVQMSVDGGGATLVANGTVLELDTKAHSFTFTCLGELACVDAKSASVGPGDEDQPISILMRFKDATLTVTGTSAASYTLNGHPSLQITPGVPVSVPMTNSQETSSVVQMPTSGKSQARGVTLKAGKNVPVTFPDVP